MSRIWRAFALQPHRWETVKLSRDRLFVDKVRGLVGLCLDPPDRALVLCVDESEPANATGSSAQASADPGPVTHGADPAHAPKPG